MMNLNSISYLYFLVNGNFIEFNHTPPHRNTLSPQNTVRYPRNASSGLTSPSIAPMPGPAMTALRIFIRAHRSLACLVLVLALAMKALVPAGYMVASGTRMMSIQICADSVGQRLTKQIVVADTGANHTTDTAKSDMAKQACPYGGHSAPVLDVTDPWLLATALAFILALGIAPVAIPRPRRASFLLPPACGPPVIA